MLLVAHIFRLLSAAFLIREQSVEISFLFRFCPFCLSLSPFSVPVSACLALSVSRSPVSYFLAYYLRTRDEWLERRMVSVMTWYVCDRLRCLLLQCQQCWSLYVVQSWTCPVDLGPNRIRLVQPVILSNEMRMAGKN